MPHTHQVYLTPKELEQVKQRLEAASYRGTYFKIVADTNEILIRDTEDFLIGRINRNEDAAVAHP